MQNIYAMLSYTRNGVWDKIYLSIHLCKTNTGRIRQKLMREVTYEGWMGTG